MVGERQINIEAPPVGLEPTTDWLTASRSTELSYGGILKLIRFQTFTHI